MVLAQGIPRSLARAMPDEMTLRQQAPEMLFQRVPACPGEADHVADGHAAMLSGLVENLDGQFGQGGHEPLFPFHLSGEAALLLL